MKKTHHTTYYAPPDFVTVGMNLGSMRYVGSTLAFSYPLSTCVLETAPPEGGRQRWVDVELRQHFDQAARNAVRDQLVAMDAISRFNDTKRARGHQVRGFNIKVTQAARILATGACTTDILLTIERVS